MAGCANAGFDGCTDEMLMIAIHQGEVDAFNVLYGRYSKRLYYYFFRMLNNSNEKAEDFLQDLFMKIIEHPDAFDPGRKFSTWLFSVAHNMCRNEYRRLCVRNSFVSDEHLNHYSESTDIDHPDDQLAADQIFAELENLSETEKTAFILYYREDFSLQEIGQVLDLPEGTIKSKLFYTRKKISRKLNVGEFK